MRSIVLWIGGEIPRGVRADLEQRFDLKPITTDALVDSASSACGLVIEVADSTPNIIDGYGAAISAALDYGLWIALIPAPETNISNYYSSAAVAANDTRLCDRINREFHIFYDHRVKLTEFLYDAPRAPPANPALRLEGDVPENEALRTLLRRGFSDARSITLESLQGGKSGAQVWLLTYGQEDRARRPLPMLVKVASREKMHREFSNAQLAADFIPFRMLPPLHKERCVEGAEFGLLVYGFLEKTIPFDDALVTHDTGTLISSLFGRTLNGCICHSSTAKEGLVEHFRRLKAFRSSDALRAAAERARGVDSTTIDVDDLEAHLVALPAQEYRVGYAHGDLHTGNLFVASASSEVLVIDFGTFSGPAPIVTDYACLEVSIAFPPPRDSEVPRTSLSRSDLRSMYSVPLVVPDRPTVSPRRSSQHEAIRAIRQAVFQVEPNRAVYEVALAAYLIRFASYPDSGNIDDRALAYELATALIRGAKDKLLGGSLVRAQ
jgi:hypothetical protein